MNNTLEVARMAMSEEMKAFPWRRQDEMEAAIEADADAAGLTIGRRRDEVLIEGHVAAAKSLAKRGIRKAVDLVVYTGTAPKPRTRDLVLTLQAVVNAGIPAVISDKRLNGHYVAAVVLLPSS